jgi:transcriptional regulator with XRE-family HTH domain
MDVPNELLRAARAALGLSQAGLAKRTGIGQRTILRIERDEHVTLDTLRRVQVAFEELGVVFVPDDGENGPGIRIRKSLIKRGDLRF